MIRKAWMVVLIGISLVTAAECRSAEGEPAKVTEAFWKALNSGGLKTARPYMTKASQAAVDRGMTFNMRGVNIIAGETNIQGNMATVIIRSPEKPGEQHTTIVMKENGRWKVDLMQTLKGMLGAEAWKQMEAFQGKTFDELLANPEIAKQMKEVQGKLLEKMSTTMPALSADMMTAMAQMMGVTAAGKSEKSMFLLPDMGWGDPFVDPRDRTRAEIAPEAVIPQLGDESKKIWEDALTELVVEVIIGLEDELAAVIAGVRVHPGDIIMGGKLKFRVENIMRNGVRLRCISEEEAHKKFLGISIMRRIIL